MKARVKASARFRAGDGARWHRGLGASPRWSLAAITVLLGLGLVGLALVGSAASQSGGPRPDERLGTFPSGDEPPEQVPTQNPTHREDQDAAFEAQRRKKEKLQSKEAKEERKRSKAEHKNKNRSEALALAKEKHPKFVAAPVWEPFTLRDGDRIKRYEGQSAAVVEHDQGPPSLVESTLPLVTTSASGQRRPVELALEDRGGAFSPRNPLVETSISKDLAEGVSLPAIDLEVSPLAGPETSTPTLVEDKAFWANVATDTDLIVSPRPGGFETLHLLRSEDSPERLDLRFRLPPGAVLRRSEREARTLEIVRDGRPLAEVAAPLAKDAQDADVPVSYELRGDTVSIRAEHRQGDFAYPVLVDPDVVEDYRFWSTNSGLDYNGWTAGPYAGAWHSNDPGGYYWSAGNVFNNRAGSYQNGLHVYGPGYDRYYYAGLNYAEWQLAAPGNSHIWYAQFNDAMFWSDYQSCYFMGIWTAAIYNYEEDYPGAPPDRRAYRQHCGNQGNYYHVGWYLCARSNCDRNGGYTGNRLNFGVNMQGSGYRRDFHAYLSGAAAWLNDKNDPRIEQEYVPSGWTKDNELLKVYAHDDGLGMKRSRFFSPTQSDYAVTEFNDGCDGARHRRCYPRLTTHRYIDNLNEGVSRVALQAWDIVDRYSNFEWEVRVDRTGPSIDVYGDLRQLQTDTSGRDLYGLRVDATDGTPNGQIHERRSGVKSIRILVDGIEQFSKTQDPGCGPDSCSLSLDDEEYLLDTDDFSEGSHRVRVEVVDEAGNLPTINEWTITIPRDGYYGQQVSNWQTAVEQRVDASNPLPLSGPMPPAPSRWRDPVDCERSEAALHDCFAANQHWADDFQRWLDANRMLTEPPSVLPDPPIYEYARSETARQLTRGIEAMFKLVKRSAADPTARLRLAVSFHAPQSKQTVTTLFSGLDVGQANVALRGIHDPRGFAISAGYRSPLVLPLADHLTRFYEAQRAENALDIGEFEEVTRGEVEGDPPEEDELAAVEEALAGERALRPTLQADGPYVKGLAAEFSVTALLNAFNGADSPLKDVRVVAADASGTEALDTLLTNAEAVKTGLTGPTRAAQSTPTCDARGDNTDTKSPLFYAPGNVSAKVALYGADEQNGLYRKRAAMNFRWKGTGLAFYCGDDEGDRGFEPETKVFWQRPRWATDQEEQWKTNMPNPYLDDLNGGRRTNLKKDEYPDFAVGSAHARRLRYNRLYYTRNILNRGERNEGTTVVRVQSVRKASGGLEQLYCNGRGRTNSSCFFRDQTGCVAHQPLRTPRMRRYLIAWLSSTNRCATDP